MDWRVSGCGKGSHILFSWAAQNHCVEVDTVDWEQCKQDVAVVYLNNPHNVVTGEGRYIA
jgi:hypothetical protein